MDVYRSTQAQYNLAIAILLVWYSLRFTLQISWSYGSRSRLATFLFCFYLAVTVATGNRAIFDYYPKCSEIFAPEGKKTLDHFQLHTIDVWINEKGAVY